MRIGLLIIFAVVIAIIAVILCIKVAKKLIGRILIVAVAICLFMGGGSIINLNCLANEAKDKVQQVVSVVGDSYIKTDGSKILILINGDWYDVSKISIVGSIATDNTIRYEGKEIYVGDSGVVGTVKMLEKLGIINNENN